jgi:NAD(P)-dependent dehydrogenase (short-subunit alcohol dehydrogenase family)
LGLNKVAIVTGGSSGIGQAIALALGHSGYDLTIVGTSTQRIEATLKQLGQNTDRGNAPLGLCLNVMQEADMQQMVDQTLKHFGRLDLLVASAGLGKQAGSTRVLPYPTASLPLEEWQDVIGVNLTGVFLSNRAVLPVMMAQQSGHIVNICSSTTPRGLRGQPFAPAYCASKFGVVGLTEALAEEVSAYGVKVQAIFPGPVKTPLLENTALLKLFGGWAVSTENFAASVIQMIEQPSEMVIVHPHLLPFRGDRPE